MIQWTRTQGIRTGAAIPVVVAIVDAGSTPIHVEIGAKAAHLRELGLSDRAIARAIGVSDKTVAKSLRRMCTGNGHEVTKLQSDLPDTLKLKEAELTDEQRRMSNFVDFIGEGRGSQALAKALIETEHRVDALSDEVDGLRRSGEKIFRPPPIEWISDRLGNLQEVLEQPTATRSP